MHKPLLHQVFAQNALVPSDKLRADEDIFMVVPQGKTSYIRRYRPLHNDVRPPGQTDRGVVCHEYDKLTDTQPDDSQVVVVKICASGVKLVFDDLTFAEQYLNWLKTSYDETVRPR